MNNADSDDKRLLFSSFCHVLYVIYSSVVRINKIILS